VRRQIKWSQVQFISSALLKKGLFELETTDTRKNRSTKDSKSDIINTKKEEQRSLSLLFNSFFFIE